MMSIRQGYTIGRDKVVTYKLVWDEKVIGLDGSVW